MGTKPRATPDELKALAHPLRWRILRLCLDRAMTNRELASRLKRDPGTVLHHVRMLVRTGFLRAEPVRHGARGALERPYRATGKTWTIDVGHDPKGNLALVDAFREELAESPRDVPPAVWRLGVRLSPDTLDELARRMHELIVEFEARDEPDGTPIGIFAAVHVRRDETGGRPRRLPWREDAR